MNSNAASVDQYLEELPVERKEAMKTLREVILKNLPPGFTEQISYGMAGYVVPLSLYPVGYHCSPGLPLPFMGFASQKNFIALYHMGLYAMPELIQWFQDEYPKHNAKKLDMGKSCMRFKHVNDIPFLLIGELAKKVTVESWIEVYEKKFKR